MRLPAELRFMILRKLLLSEQPLADRRRYPGKNSSSVTRYDRSTSESLETRIGSSKTASVPQLVSGYGLDPTILQTCQKLSTECWQMLYGENTTGLRISYLDFHPFSLSWGPERLESAISLPAYRVGSNSKGRLRTARALNEKEVDFALRFTHFHFELDMTYGGSRPFEPEVLRPMLRALASNTTNSTITARIACREEGDGDSIMVFAKAFKIVRCRALSFSGMPDTLASDIEDIVATATGTTPIVDLRERYDHILSHSAIRYFTHSLGNGQKPGSVLNAWADRKITALRTAVVDCDASTFDGVIAEIIPEIDREFRELEPCIDLEYQRKRWELEYEYERRREALRESYAVASGVLKDDMGAGK